YLAESALLRAERLAGGGRAEAAGLLARLYAFEAVDRARALGREALRRAGGQSAGGPTARLEAYLPDHGQDLIALRRQAADLTYAAGGYPLACGRAGAEGAESRSPRRAAGRRRRARRSGAPTALTAA